MSQQKTNNWFAVIVTKNCRFLMPKKSGDGAKMLYMLIPRVQEITMCVSLICKKKQRIERIVDFYYSFLGRIALEPTMLPRSPFIFFFYSTSIWHSIILRELLFAFLFAFQLLYHLSDAITSRLFYILCIWAQNEWQKWYPKDLLLLDSRIHTAFIDTFTHTHIYIRTRSVYIF